MWTKILQIDAKFLWRKQINTNLLGRAPYACCSRPRKPLDRDGCPIRTYGASMPTKAMLTTTPTKRSATYNSNSAQKSLPLFWTSANVAQQESITICIVLRHHRWLYIHNKKDISIPKPNQRCPQTIKLSSSLHINKIDHEGSWENFWLIAFSKRYKAKLTLTQRIN